MPLGEVVSMEEERASVAEYRKLSVRQYAARVQRQTAEGRYWGSFKSPTALTLGGPVTYVEASPVAPYTLACTASTRVTLLDTVTRQPKKVISRHKDVAYSASWKPDGKLLVTGGEGKLVQVFDTASRNILRSLRGHEKAVHLTRYAPDGVHLFSASDDCSVKWWDVALGECVSTFEGHTDYARAGCVSPASADLWATGSFDHTVRLWDVRVGRCVLEMKHEAPVEDVLLMPSGSLMLSAASNQIYVWDLMGGGRVLTKTSSHQKVVTCLRHVPPAGPNAEGRVLSGSLDGYVKVHDLNTYKVTHATKFPGPVLSVSLTRDNMMLGVGMADGYVATRKRAEKATTGFAMGRLSATQAKKQQKRERRLTASTYRYFVRGQSEKAAMADQIVAQRRRQKLAPHDKHLKGFRYAEALDSALELGNVEVIVSLLEELAARGGLQSALRNRDVTELASLMAFLSKYVADPRHARLLIGVSHLVIDIYADILLSKELKQQFMLLKERVTIEVRTQQKLQIIQGMLDPILNASLST
mmetsp:Transcript_6720/g.24874  ORF Transcript_6720/g.24874 Transcript_6720/m.24874 type:complete len:529 (+) Transcript_6720:71-1657(+)